MEICQPVRPALCGRDCHASFLDLRSKHASISCLLVACVLIFCGVQGRHRSRPLAGQAHRVCVYCMHWPAVASDTSHPDLAWLRRRAAELFVSSIGKPGRMSRCCGAPGAEGPHLQGECRGVLGDLEVEQVDQVGRAGIQRQEGDEPGVGAGHGAHQPAFASSLRAPT